MAQPETYADWQAYVADLDHLNGIESIPTFFAARRILGDAGVWLIAVTVALSVFTSVIGFYRASARILMNMAEDNILTGGFRRPTFCLLFLRMLSVVICAFGRQALQWIVDLSSFGAVVGFGYASLAVYRLGSKRQARAARITGFIGIVVAVGFAVGHLVPGISRIETMSAECRSWTAWRLPGSYGDWTGPTRSLCPSSP